MNHNFLMYVFYPISMGLGVGFASDAISLDYRVGIAFGVAATGIALIHSRAVDEGMSRGVHMLNSDNEEPNESAPQ